MSAAQEEEIRQLHEQLATARAEKAAETARASALQVALFEAGMKARQAMDACKRDAVEVAVEEAVRQHYVSMAEMEEMVNRSVGQISRDKALLLTLRGSFLSLKSKAADYARALQQQEEKEEEGRPQEQQSTGDGAVDNGEDGPSGDNEGKDAQSQGQDSKGEQDEDQAECVERNSEALHQAVRRLLGTDNATTEPGGEESEGEGSTSPSDSKGLDDQTAATIHAAIEVAALACAVMVSPDMTSFLEDNTIESTIDKEGGNDGAQKLETDEVTASGDGDGGDGTSEPSRNEQPQEAPMEVPTSAVVE